MNPLFEAALQVAAILVLIPFSVAIGAVVESWLASAPAPSMLAPYRRLANMFTENRQSRGSWIANVLLAASVALTLVAVASIPVFVDVSRRSSNILVIIGLIIIADVALAISAFDEDERSAKRRTWSLPRIAGASVPLLVATCTLVATSGSAEAAYLAGSATPRDILALAAPVGVFLLAACTRLVPFSAPFTGRSLALAQLARLATSFALAALAVRMLFALPFIDSANALYGIAPFAIVFALLLGALGALFHAAIAKMRLSVDDVTIISLVLAIVGFVIMIFRILV